MRIYNPMSPEPRIPLSFSLSESAGSLGDFGTIIPLILAVALVSDVNPRYILLFFGIWFILTGLYYRLPIPLEPMKAVAVIVIAAGVTGGISSGEIAAAGMVLGIIFLMLGYGRFFEIIERWVPESVVRGIQLGLALLLFRASAGFVIQDPVLLRDRDRDHRWFPHPCPLPFGSGPLIDLRDRRRFHRGTSSVRHSPDQPDPGARLVLPVPSDFPSALATLVLPQLVLTIANAILATSLLTKDLFGKDVPPKKFSTTIGLMNLTSVPFGGFPMCHGAGGLAGQYRYGARTGGRTCTQG